MPGYLQTRPNALQQWRRGRRAPLRPQVSVHTTESGVGSAWSVAEWMTRRTNHGSYHRMVDHKTRIKLVDTTDEAWHVAPHRLNHSTTGLSAACRTVDWARMDAATRAGYVRNLALEAADLNREIRAITGRRVEPRFLTLAQVLDGWSGFYRHSAADPDRRSDPGKDFPEAAFLTEYRRLIEGAPEPPKPKPKPEPEPEPDAVEELPMATPAEREKLINDIADRAAERVLWRTWEEKKIRDADGDATRRADGTQAPGGYTLGRWMDITTNYVAAIRGILETGSINVTMALSEEDIERLRRATTRGDVQDVLDAVADRIRAADFLPPEDPEPTG